MSATEKDTVMATEQAESVGVSEHDKNRVEQVHADGKPNLKGRNLKTELTSILGTIDYVAKEIVGGDIGEMPKGYYRSPAFIGTVVATCTASMCAYVGWVLPANTLYAFVSIRLNFDHN